MVEPRGPIVEYYLGTDSALRDVPTIYRGDAPVANVIAIANQKGGVGKTTTAINLGGALAEQGYRVLCIDMDPQANLTVGLGINLGTVERSVADVLADSRATMAEIVIPTQTTGIDVAPATLELASTEVELFSAIGREHALREALDGWVDQHYDFALIDCPPTLGLLTINALVAARSVIIPVQTQYYAPQGPDRAGQGDQHDPGQAESRPARARPAAHVLRRPDDPWPGDARRAA